MLRRGLREEQGLSLLIYAIKGYQFCPAAGGKRHGRRRGQKKLSQRRRKRGKGEIERKEGREGAQLGDLA